MESLFIIFCALYFSDTITDSFIHLLQASYTHEGVKGVLKEGGTKRRDALEEIVKGLGGSLESIHFAFGDDDVYSIVTMPDNVSAASVSMAITASGAVKMKTVVLLTPEEIDKATQMGVKYRAPGR